MDTVAFLRHVLAVGEGWICIGVWKERGFLHRWFETPEEAARWALAQDAAGETVYHACAVFNAPTTRRQANAACLKALFADLDVGPDKPYRTRAEASAALTDFLVATSLPIPTIVHSGEWGMHLYWVLDEPLPASRWKPAAIALRQLFKQHGFKVDTARTADASSVLRPPGTHNRKRGLVHPVTVVHESTPVWLGDIIRLGRAVEPQLHQTRNAPPLLQDAAAYANIPSDAHKVAAGCAHIRNLRDAEGNLPYYLWLFSIWTLHFTAQGDDIAHEWSKGYPKYTFEETQRKLDEASSPITCARFEEHDEDGRCSSCPHLGRISTPLELGRERFAPAPLPVPQHKLNGVAHSPFINDTQGLRFATENKKGEAIEELISRVPIFLRHVSRGERAPDHSLLFELETPKEGLLPLSIPAGVFFSAQGMPEMARMGAVIHDPELLRMYVRQQMDEYNQNNAPVIRYDQFGWKEHDNAFLVGTKLYTASQVVNCPGSPEVERRARLLGPRSGSLSAWSAAANKLFAQGCEPHSFALCCAFGAPLMHFHSEEGGAILNLVSEQSATGKTTGLEAVSSVWGELNGIKLTDEDTHVSRGLLLGTLGNLPCVFDELHKRDPDTIRSFILMFTNGRDRLRARSDGTLRDPSGEWQTILILGSNLSLTDILQSNATEEAQAYRVLELQAEQNFSGQDGDRLRRELKANAGWAGDAYIRYLMKPGVLAVVREELELATQVLYHSPNYRFGKEHRFWVRMIACAHVAGRIINQLGILDFNHDRIVHWVIDQLRNRITTEVKRDYVQVLNEALYDLWASTIVVDIEWRPRTACNVLSMPSRDFVARRVRDSGRMYISRVWLRRWLTEHMVNRSSFTNSLKEKGIIVNENKFITLGAGTPYNVGGQLPCFEVNMNHPDMLGMLEQADATILRFPDGASLSPPQTSQ